MSIYFAAFILSFAGSLHCIGMCGPLIVSMHMKSNLGVSVRETVLYHSARILVYISLGFILGAIGFSAALATSQQIISIVVGTCLLVILFLQYFKGGKYMFRSFSFFQANLSKWFYAHYKSDNHFVTIFFAGILNGLLPCGLVYIAFASSITLVSPMQSAAFMFCFGLGTLPSMILVLYISKYVKREHLFRIKKVIPVIVAFTGVLLLLRGMNLNIPYISPHQNASECKVECCPK